MALPTSWKDRNIAQIEMINILVALKVWHKAWSCQKVLIKCDNLAVVSVLNNGRAQDQTWAKYARNIFMWASACNIELRVVHVAGKQNPIADLLSRWFITPFNFQKLQELVGPVTWMSTVLYCTLTSQFKLSYVIFDVLILTECQPLERQLTVMATSRLSQAFSQSTKKAYGTMFKTFLAFVAFMNWDLLQVNVFSLLCFLECLQFNGVKHTQMSNYLSAIKSTFLIYGLDVHIFLMLG